MTKLEINLIYFIARSLAHNQLGNAGEALKFLAKLVTGRMGM